MLRPHFTRRGIQLWHCSHHLEAVPMPSPRRPEKVGSRRWIDMKFKLTFFRFMALPGNELFSTGTFSSVYVCQINALGVCSVTKFSRKPRLSVPGSHRLKQAAKFVRVLAACNDRLTQDQAIGESVRCSADRIIYQLIVPEYARRDCRPDGPQRKNHTR